MNSKNKKSIWQIMLITFLILLTLFLITMPLWALKKETTVNTITTSVQTKENKTIDTVIKADEGQTFYNNYDMTSSADSVIVPEILYIDTSAIWYASIDNSRSEGNFYDAISFWIDYNYDVNVHVSYGSYSHFYDENGKETTYDHFACYEGSQAKLGLWISGPDENSSASNIDFDKYSINIVNEAPGDTYTTDNVIKADEGQTFYNYDFTSSANSVIVPETLYIDTSAIWYASIDNSRSEGNFYDAISFWINYNYDVNVHIAYGNNSHFYDENGKETTYDHFACYEGSQATLGLWIYGSDTGIDFDKYSINIVNQKPGIITTTTQTQTNTTTEYTNETVVLATSISLASATIIFTVIYAWFVKKY